MSQIIENLLRTNIPDVRQVIYNTEEFWSVYLSSESSYASPPEIISGTSFRMCFDHKSNNHDLVLYYVVTKNL